MKSHGVKSKPLLIKTHKYVFGYAAFTGILLLLERNNLWNDAVQKYISQFMSSCRPCRSTATTDPVCKVSIYFLSKEFSNTVFVDMFYLDIVRLMKCMDLVTRYSAVYKVTYDNM